MDGYIEVVQHKVKHIILGKPGEYGLAIYVEPEDGFHVVVSNFGSKEALSRLGGAELDEFIEALQDLRGQLN